MTSLTIGCTIRALLYRYWLEYRQVWKALLVRDLMDRLLFLFAFGFGMGAIVREMGDVTYLAYIAPGIACSSPMMTMTMATTFGAYERSNSSKVWQSWLATPIRVPEILISEIIYANLRSMPAVFILLALVWGMGALPNPAGVIYAIPLILLANFTYGAIGLCFTAHINRIMYFTFINTLWMMPMYLFSGVFFDLSQTPMWMQTIAQIFPLTHVINIVRPLLLEQNLETTTIIYSLFMLVAVFVLAFWYASYAFTKKLMR